MPCATGHRRPSHQVTKPPSHKVTESRSLLLFECCMARLLEGLGDALRDRPRNHQVTTSQRRNVTSEGKQGQLRLSAPWKEEGEETVPLPAQGTSQEGFI